MRQITKLLATLTLCVLLLCSVAGAFAATSGSHYPFGGEGVMAASMPPPGFHYRVYNTWYNPTQTNNDSGDNSGLDFNLDVFSSVHRFIHVTGIKILGADYTYNLIVPLVSKDISITDFGISDSKSLSMGDIVLEPFALGWHGKRWDASLGLAIIAPTGEYDAHKPASPGLGYWSGMLTLGGTYFFDEQKTLSFSALTRTLVNTEQDDTGVTPGSEFVVEYGLGKMFHVSDNFLVRPGIAGCAYWQLEDDSDDGPGTFADERKRAAALGLEINLMHLPSLIQANLRVLREFEARNTAEGSMVTLTLTKSF
ncbi:SphA family protein [Desulfosediminicola ganghwensis]|uniref:SphA family protein n=1 Tax=Desulfosediminicola ganghwensis TaxID=2569540 RepID=UPI001C3C5BDF|nr:transporter [Desulfosediminicola ganghwensis]